MDDEKVPRQQDDSPSPQKPTAAAAPPASRPAPPKPEAPSLPPLEMISPQLRAFIEQKVRSGETVTVEVGKDAFTGRIFRIMLQEGWIALEHADGRRRMFFVITGGRIRAAGGETVDLPGGHSK